ncbi:hypothetical protein MP638_006965 [Amoeboaphelidium occidentale]|nr:hypothetical protein MP638_006965 [Amoeboaphelidium occidentale]
MSKPIQIKPFRRRNTHGADEHEVIWSKLSGAIQQIHQKNASSLSFEELYRNAYNLVMSKHGGFLYDKVSNQIQGHLLSLVKSKLAPLKGTDLLNTLRQIWNDHKLSMSMIRDILLYLDRAYVRNTKTVAVYDMGMDLFRDNVLRNSDIPIRQRFQEAMFAEILRDRQGEIINKSLLKSMTVMLLDLGNDSLQSRKTVYCVDFQDEFLRLSREYYKNGSTACMRESNASMILERFEIMFAQEQERVNHYLLSSTLSHIMDVLKEELIEKNMNEIVKMDQTGMSSMLTNDRIQDLSRLFSLFGKVSKGHDLVREEFALFIRTNGDNINGPVDPEGTSQKASQSVAVPWVESAIAFKSKLQKILEEAFMNDNQTETVFNSSFQSFVGRNPRAAEYVSIYLDEHLSRKIKLADEELEKYVSIYLDEHLSRKIKLADGELEKVINHAMQLFRFIPDKDIFERFYKQYLAKRLLLSKNVSEDLERSVVAKLKSETGNQFTSKLEGMFTDIRISSENMTHFKQYLTQNNIKLPCDLNVNVLTSTFWPLTNASVDAGLSTNNGYPEPIVKCAEVFQDFYLGRHNGRKLDWQTTLGSLDIVVKFEKRKHELLVSFYQGAILMFFNDEDTLFYEDLKAKIRIPEPELVRSLQSLSCGKYKVLLKNPKSKDISSSDVFTFNNQFTCPQYRIKIPTVSLAAQEQDSQAKDTAQKITEGRKFMIDAAIVRVMKSRQRMEHSQLIVDVTSQLTSRFIPDPLMIKKQIEVLIDREYLERVEGNARMYQYVA